MKNQHGLMGKFKEGLDSYISVHYPELYKDLQDDSKKDLNEIKEKSFKVFQEYLDKVRLQK